ncbi:Terpene cyclase/mutase family member [Rhynchospora pubera]|uniref:Terpene cyclase/mutase family member n=1 Tax=Rhynchospora pubera TaxID=906938 RepID=A0AAV8CCC7_9POAL|nr:Terpene cyclase/mutase family member [Rhynchospora pubera]
MWRLKVAEGNNPWLRTTNNHVGRQVWEFDPDFVSQEERDEVERGREAFRANRFQMKHSSDLLMRHQFARLNPLELDLPVIKLGENEQVTEEKIISLYVTGALNTVLSPEHQKEMRRYLYNHQNKDGGWGLHIEGHSTMLGSVLSYVTLRLLGEGANGGDGDMEKAREWILSHGSATAITSWGKMWLSVLGVFDWSGNNPLPPEIWLLPYILPVHPGRMCCHARMVYLPMSYIYGKRIDWDKARNECAKEDLYYPHPMMQDILWATLHKFVEPVLLHWPGNRLREGALNTVIQHIHYEDENTRYICIGPVNKVLNMLCCWIEDPSSEAFKLHIPRIYDYLWIAEDGMKMQGYNGSQLWDAAFSVQAIKATGLVEEYAPTLFKAHNYVKHSQVLEDCPGDLSYWYWYRHISKGAWPFSTADHGWPISDCIAEGLKAALLVSKLPQGMVGEPIQPNRLYDAVNVILSLMNDDGGFSTYELTRSYAWMELINPAETFGNIVIDYPYVECTSAAIQALTEFRKLYPGHCKKDIDFCISKAVIFIESIQLPDGSWYGSWAVCFTYGIWNMELPSGGWGESYLSCENKVYTNLEGNRARAVNTAWAMLALIDAGQVLMFSGVDQLTNGEWRVPSEIMGVFNANCMISYSQYRNIFPIWALGEYRCYVLLANKND